MRQAPGAGRNVGSARVDAVAIAAAKSVLRKAILLRRDLRPVEQRRSDDAARTARLVERLSRTPPRTAAAYLSTAAEPGTLQLISWLAAQRARVLLPSQADQAGPVQRQEPAWAEYSGPDNLRVGPSSILEPTGTPLAAEALGKADLIICPGLAGNVRGARLGRGGGWYDRALAHAAPDSRVWLLLNDDEVLEAIPTNEGDVAVDAIVTPTRFIRCH